MNRLVLIFLLIFIGFSSSCEKDDLCTPDQRSSPRMMVVFKDALNPAEIKEVEQLQVREIGKIDYAPLDFDGSTLLTSVDTIYLPLRNFPELRDLEGFTELTSYNFVALVEEEIAVDNVNFSYVTEDVYVNRACGFKADYNNLNATRTEESGNTFWIQSVIVIQNAINNSNEVHVEIRH